MKKYFFLPVILIIFLLSGCYASKVSNVTGTLDHKLRIALSPSGGIVAEAIGIELFNRGFTIIDTQQMQGILARLNLTEIEISETSNLKVLKDQGIDAIMFVKSIAGYDNQPQSISLRINDTKEWKVIAGITWQNGGGGQMGSAVDRGMRKDVTEASQEIVSALLSDGN